MVAHTRYMITDSGGVLWPSGTLTSLDSSLRPANDRIQGCIHTGVARMTMQISQPAFTARHCLHVEKKPCLHVF